MSIVKPHKLGIITGPGSEYLSGKIVKHLKGLYVERYHKLSKNLAYRYNMTEEEILREVSFIDDLGNKKIPSGKCPTEFICPNFDIPVKYTRFLNGEVKAEILEPVRGIRIYIIYDVTNDIPMKINGCENPISFSVNDHIMMLFTIINALNLAGAESVTLVLPTYPYARQHKKSSREALTAALFGQMCEGLGVERIITLDIHSKEIENCFRTVHLENLHASYQFLVELRKIIDISDPDITVVSPDVGAVSRNKFYAQILHRPLAMLYKERDYSIVTTGAKNTNIKSINLLGDVNGKTVIIADDMLASGGTMLIAMKFLRERGAKKIICIVSLPFFNGNAIETFDKAHDEGAFDYVIGTNAVYHNDSLLSKKWFIQTDASELFARTINRLHHGRAISPLLDNRKIVQRLVDDVQEAAAKKQASEQKNKEGSDGDIQ
ncbi:MAG: ribose-phosphate diphosphokinase [Spirochaetales bacterium]|nr:ribose-phosphate diphosphokinase [Spirochaetales bacterium]